MAVSYFAIIQVVTLRLYYCSDVDSFTVIRAVIGRMGVRIFIGRAKAV
jgi:hypothetical protein